jgi:hypothetical protein
MRRVYVAASLAILAVGATLFLYRATPAEQPRSSTNDSSPAKAVQLPIGQVVLFSSGVGYFQREGAVEGNARVDLSFPVSDINDLLKSMVVRDLDGGHVSTISYDSNAPVERTLKSFAINLTGDPSFGQILNQARGEKVEVVLQQANATQPGTLTGTVIGLEKQKQAVGKDTVEVELLNLWCADGVRSLKLSEVQRLRFLNPILDGEFKKALETLATSHDTQKKAVSMHFMGEGKRQVRVGYVIENPIWKTSYRLVLDKKEKPYLQGWAVVENPTDEDWKDVRMALVSGRPIAFMMDLYTPLYVPRPTVEPALFASLRPQTYSGNLDADGREKPPAAAMRIKDGVANTVRLEENLQQRAGQSAIPSSLPMLPNGRTPYFGLARAKELEKRMNLADSVAGSATAAKLCDYFQYALDRPVSLPRQKSAMLPIVAKDVEGSRVSIYNEQTQAKFPLLGLKLKNTSGLHLMQGPITVFEGSNYAGDSRIMDLQPGEERLLSFAIDLGTEVNPVPASDNTQAVKKRHSWPPLLLYQIHDESWY